MSQLINDNTLAGFWPLNEASGAPRFHNYAPSHANGVISGISFDLNVHTTDVSFREFGGRAAWPGTTSVFNSGSGTTYTGFQVNGLYDTDPDTVGDPFGKVLTVGQGAFGHKRLIVPPPVAQSGFTIGLWVNPQSNGILPTSDYSNRTLAKQHSLISQSSADRGLHIGVSGRLTSAAQNDAGHDKLAAYFHGINGAGSTIDPQQEITLNTPIESGRYTHITCVMRLQSSTEHHFALFKDGRLASSGQRTISTAAHQLTSNANTARDFADRVLTIGGTNDEADLLSDDMYEHSTGWGHLVSGVYAFKRPLDEGEILALHNAGGLQPTLGAQISAGQVVEITDTKLIGYYPFLSTGYADASRIHSPLLSESPERETRSTTQPSIAAPTAGPFNRGGYMQADASNQAGLATGSGTINELLSNRSFTILGHFSPEAGNSSFLQNIMFSLGAVDTTETQTISHQALGFFLGTDDDISNKRFLMRVFENGHAAAEIALTGVATDIWTATNSHFAFVYDDQTTGIQFYIDGYSQGSGTLILGSMIPHLERLTAGSGLPFIFGNAVNGSAAITEDIFHTAGGQDCQMSNLIIFGRPLQKQEINYIAHSGISLSPLNYTVHDPRLMGYWKGTETIQQLVPDRARVWDKTPGNLVRSLSNYNWNTVLYNSANRGPLFRVDYFDDIEPTTLGLTSGVWSLLGGSLGNHTLAAASSNERRSHYASTGFRVKPCPEERDLGKQALHSQYIVSFEVTPDGNIPATVVPTDRGFNSTIFSISEDNDGLYGFLTSINGQTNIGFVGKDSAAFTWLGSGQVTYQATSRVLLYIKAADPYVHADPANEILQVQVYVNGTKTSSYETTTTLARAWSDQTIGSSTEDWALQIGGEAIRAMAATPSTITNQDAGLGQVSVRNIFIMNGVFSSDDITYLATNGITDSPSITGYTNEQSTTQVTASDINLQGYWRFSDPVSANGTLSGITDLSSAGNDLYPLAKVIADKNGFASSDNAAYNLRFVPGPFVNADVSVKSSGITWAGNSPLFTSIAPPFIVSGVPFTDPENGFSVGFWYSSRNADVTLNTAETILSFGRAPTSATDTTDVDACWAVYIDDSENILMILSKDGRMYLDNAANAARAGSIRAGAYTSKVIEENNILEQHRYNGAFSCGHVDAWNHVVWTYDPAGFGTLTCYYNGILVDQKSMNGTALNVPADPTAKFISIFAHQEDGVWQFDGNIATENVVLTDLFYFDRVVTEAEARYIAYNGIDAETGTLVSGIFGGFLHGQDTVSGIFGNFIRGQDTLSGIFGGYVAGSTPISGIIGAYVSGIVFTDASMGGFLRGLDNLSGIAGFYLHGSDLISGVIGAFIPGLDTVSGLFGSLIIGNDYVSGILGGFIYGIGLVSGICGGYVLGGLSGLTQFDGSFEVRAVGNSDFNAITQLLMNFNSDFDAKVIIFQDEGPPIVDIIVPSDPIILGPAPFNQYFIGSASGTQGKSIVKTRWTFGDFTPPVEVARSGVSFYPVQHLYTRNGFMIAKFEAIDSDGVHASDIVRVNASGAFSPVAVEISATPQFGLAPLDVQFSSFVNPPVGVSIVARILDFDDGQKSLIPDITHTYNNVGYYRPVFTVLDSRNTVWCDSLTIGTTN